MSITRKFENTYRTGSVRIGQKIRIHPEPDPDPKHCLPVLHAKKEINFGPIKGCPKF